MSEIAIRVRSLGKRYQLGAMRSIDRQLKEVIGDKLHKIVRGKSSQGESAAVNQTKDDEFWALRNVDFDLAHGEVLGVVGRNGAGKSTLLKILSRITDPTEGEARIYGRVGSLLEVGTGFHPELTGRENIYLNGAIMGMSRAEIKRKFDEIVEFSGVARFLDTPVKRYSSGMSVRLAFSVAAHLEPEVLIVDEVLAVGDAEFQKKCLGKMEDVSKAGRAILFVSHNLGAVADLCSKALWLENGVVKATDSPVRVISDYLQVSKLQLSGTYLDAEGKNESRDAYVAKAQLLDSTECPTNQLQFRESFFIQLQINSNLPLSRLRIAIQFFDQRRKFLTAVNTLGTDVLRQSPANQNIVQCAVPTSVLMPDIYRVDIVIGLANHILQHLEDALSFSVLDHSETESVRCTIRRDSHFALNGIWSLKPWTAANAQSVTLETGSRNS